MKPITGSDDPTDVTVKKDKSSLDEESRTKVARGNDEASAKSRVSSVDKQHSVKAAAVLSFN